MSTKPSRRSLLQVLGLAPGVLGLVHSSSSAAAPAPAADPPPAPARQQDDERAETWLAIDTGGGRKAWIPLFALALLVAGAVALSSCSTPADASPLAAMIDRADAGAGQADEPAVVALAKVDDSGMLVRSFNVADVERTGTDANFSVKVTLGPVPPLERLYALATLSDARSGFTVDLGQTVGGPVTVDLAVEPDHTSGFYLAIFASP
jgi:hypothetical protein